MSVSETHWRLLVQASEPQKVTSQQRWILQNGTTVAFSFHLSTVWSSSVFLITNIHLFGYNENATLEAGEDHYSLWKDPQII